MILISPAKMRHEEAVDNGGMDELMKLLSELGLVGCMG